MSEDLIPIVKDRHFATFRRIVGGPSNRDGSDQRTRKECWGAHSTDGVWRFDRLDDVGTPWDVTYLPDPTIYMPHGFSSLLKARRWVTRHGDAYIAQVRQAAAS